MKRKNLQKMEQIERMRSIMHTRVIFDLEQKQQSLQTLTNNLDECSRQSFDDHALQAADRWQNYSRHERANLNKLITEMRVNIQHKRAEAAPFIARHQTIKELLKRRT